jgi:integrase
MPKIVVNALTPLRVKREKCPGYYADGDGLYLVVTATGGKFWSWRGTVQGRRREVGIGPERLVKLAEAREIARTWRNIARAGGDPKAERDKDKRQSLTFEDAARRVHKEHVEPDAKSAKAAAQWLKTLTVYACPVIGAKPVHGVTQSDVLRVLAPIWTEKPETARRVRQRVRTVMDWARTAGHCSGINPVEGVEKGLPKQRGKVQHFRALHYTELPDFMQRLDGAEGIGVLALRLCILTAARSGEVRLAEWSEIDTVGRVWTVPADRMKARQEHRVPLSDAAIAVLDAAAGLSERLVFPSRKEGVPLSDMTISAVLRRLNVPATVHGFRSTFRDWAEERTGFSYEAKEAALAHTIKSATERAYRRGDLFDQRRSLMDEWARFCLSASSAGKVLEMRR